MKVTFPHMGHVDLIMEDLFTRFETDFIAPPPTTNKTISLGASLSPELACLPLKVTLGNMVEGLEAGADTIAMAGGMGPCRFGYYAQVQQEILREAGYDFQMIIVEPPVGGLDMFIGAFRKLSGNKNLAQLWQGISTSFKKARAIDILEKKANEIKPFEAKRGETGKALKTGLQEMRAAFSLREIKSVSKNAIERLEAVPVVDRDVLKIGLAGEFYLLLDPFINFDIEDYLAKRHVYTQRSVYLTDWISPSSKNVVSGHPQKEIKAKAEGLLSHWVGGEGQATIGHTVLFSEQNFDGLIHLFPFTCMPEIIAQGILPKASGLLNMPYLTLVFDEQTGRSGVITRLEAFLDMLWSKKKAKDLAAQKEAA